MTPTNPTENLTLYLPKLFPFDMPLDGVELLGDEFWYGLTPWVPIRPTQHNLNVVKPIESTAPAFTVFNDFEVSN